MSKPTRTYDQYEIVKIPFPFADIKSTKFRPALILSLAKSFNAKIGLSVMTMITSVKLHQDPWPSDILIDEYELAGLTSPSLIRFKMFTLDHRLIVDRIGKLSSHDQHQVQKKLKEILAI